MHLVDLRAEVQSFQDSQENLRLENFAEEQLRYEQGEVTRGQKLRRWNKEAKEFLGELGVRKILGIIRDEVWEEGQIDESSSLNMGRESVTSSLSLSSNPCSVAQYCRYGYSSGRVVTSRWVKSFDITVEYRGSKKPCKVTISERPFLNLNLENPSEIKRLVEEHGLRAGLERASGHSILESESPRFGSYHGEEIEFNGRSTEMGEFKALVLAFINGQIARKDLPKDIRAYTSAIVAEMPASLKTRGEVTQKELEAWAREIRGPNPLYCRVRNIWSALSVRLPL